MERALLILLRLLLSFWNLKMVSVELSSNWWPSCLPHKADFTFFSHNQHPFAGGKASVSCISPANCWGKAGWDLPPPKRPGVVPLHQKHKHRDVRCGRWSLQEGKGLGRRWGVLGEMRAPTAQFAPRKVCTLEMLLAFLSSGEGWPGEAQVQTLKDETYHPSVPSPEKSGMFHRPAEYR